MGDSVKEIVARACDGRYPKMFGEHGPPPMRTAESVSSAAAEDGSKLLQPSATKGKTTRLIKGCLHTIMEVYVKPCLKCTRMCNCGFNYFSETKYPDVLVRSLDGHLVQLSGEMVRASDSLREMVDKLIFGEKPLKLEEVNVVLERERNGDFNSILKYTKVDINGMALGGAGGTRNDQVVALPVEASDQPKQRPSFANYPIRNAARNFAKMKAEVKKAELKKMREKAKESKADPPVPPVAIETPPASPTPPSTNFTAKKKGTVRYVFLKVEMPPLFKGRQFTHPKQNPIKVEEIDESTTPIADLIELGERNSKILALFDQKSKRPTLGVCKDTLLKIQYFMNMHLDDVERKAGAMNRLFQFQDTSAYSDSLFEKVSDMKLSNSCGYDDWEEEFFNQMDSQTFLDIQQANQEILIWDLYNTLEKWVFLNRGFPQEMVNGFLDLVEEKPDDFDPNDTRAAVFSVPFMQYPNPYRTSYHLCGKNYPLKLPRINYRPTWFRITKPL